MKNQVLIILGLMLGSLDPASAQDPAKTAEVFDRYSALRGTFSMTLNHDMLDAIDLDFDWKDQMKNVSGDIHHVRFIAFGEESWALSTVQKLGSELSQIGFKTIELPENEDMDDVKYIRLYGQKKGSIYEQVYLLLVSDDGLHGLFLEINGKMKISQVL